MSRPPSPLGRAAVAYVERLGWRAFPCAPHAKRPLTEHGYLDATADAAQIERWWSRWPDANVGIECSPRSGLLAVDIDPRAGGDDAWSDLIERNGALPDTPCQLTGGGGLHFLFKHPGGRFRGAVAPGVEIKAAGYILAAPSEHPSGNRYAWELSAHPLELEIAELPAWLFALARDARPESQRTAAPDVEATAFPLGAAFVASGMLGRKLGPGRWAVACPNEQAHTSGQRFDGSSVLFAPDPARGQYRGAFHCSHAHCEGIK